MNDHLIITYDDHKFDTPTLLVGGKDESNITILNQIWGNEAFKIYQYLTNKSELKILNIKFENTCECIFEEEILFNAIDLECKKRNCYRHDTYKIYLHGGYPCISLGHDKIRIHILIGKLIYGSIRKGYVIHHKDHNKLNALSNNLEYLSNAAHAKLHKSGNDFRSEDGKIKSANAAKEQRYRKEITKEEINEMLSQGKSKVDIANHFKCGVNTIYRRLGSRF